MKIIVIAIGVFFSCSVTAQTRDTLLLWNDKVPNETREKQRARQTDDTSGGVIRLTDVTNPILTVFKPKIPNGSKAGIIICPGGGYKILAIDKGGTEVAEWLNSLGYTAFVLQYRVPNKQQGALQDAQRAIRLVRANAVLYDVDPQKIGFMGFSAGGHLAANAATNFQKNTYVQVDAIDDLSSRPDFTMLIYPAYLDKGENRSLSPELKLEENTSPFFIFGTVDDPYGNSSLVMTTALRDTKIPVTLHMLPQGGHGYGLRKGNIAAETWPLLAENWLHKMVPPKEGVKFKRTHNFPKIVEYPKNIPPKKDVWVFLMAGQSNMAGRGFVEPLDTISSTRILTINKNNEIILAKEPLHFYEPTMAGLDSGMSFARNLIKEVPENVSVLLIPTAVGGSAIGQWIGDSLHRNVKLLSNFKQKVVLAKKYGTVKGILWHQGESDASPQGVAAYAKSMSILAKEFRSAVGQRNLPIVAGELGNYSKKEALWMALNRELHNYTKKDKNFAVISAADLDDKGDRVHFNSEGQRMLGLRYAEAYLKIKK